jgi:hypothetical protein
MTVQYSALKVDDIPEDQRKWMEPIVNQLNTFQSSTLELNDGKLSLSRNSVNDYFTFRVVGEQFPVSLRVGPGPAPTGALIVRVVDTQTKVPPIMASAPHVVFESKGDQILIRHIGGLTKGTAYMVTLLLLREEPSPVTAANPQTANAPSATTTRPIPAVLTNWTSFSPEWLGASANPAILNGTITGYRRRVGDSMQGRIRIVMGSTTTYGTGTWLWTIPDGQRIDVAKWPGGGVSANSDVDVVGKAGLLDNGTASFPGYAMAYSPTQIMVRPWNAAGTNVAYTGLTVTSTAPFTWAQNDVLFLDFEVPIAGWSAGDGT